MATELMTTHEAARYLRLSEEGLKRKARAGMIPAAKIGRAWRFVRSELDAWLRSDGTWREQMEDRGIAVVMAERMADPANYKFRPLEEVLQERGL